MTDFYIYSTKHTNRKDPWVTFWRPENKGYAWPLEWSGKYTAAEVETDQDYYDDGASTVAVPVDAVEKLKVAAVVDGKHVYCLPNNKQTKAALIAERRKPIPLQVLRDAANKETVG